MASTIEQKINECINTSEVIQVGWYNGKPLYRKYVIAHPTQTGITSYQFDAVTFGYIDAENSYAVATNGNVLPMYYASATEGWYAYFRRTNNAVGLNCFFSDPSALTGFYIAVLYTTT